MRRSAPRPGRAVALVLALAAAGAPPPAAAAVVVESAQAPPGVLSPLAPGDELSGWRQPGTTPVRTAEFSHWGDLDLLAFLESPRGTLEIDLVRGGEPRRVTLLPAAWTFRGRPRGASDELVALVASFAAPESAPTAAEVDRRLAAEPAEARSWAWKRFAEARGRAADWLAAHQAFVAAIAAAPPPTAADLERLDGDALRRLGRIAEAEAAYRRSLALWNEIEPAGLGASMALGALGHLAGAQYDLAAANRQLLEAARIRERLAPGSWLHANALNNLGMTAGRRNDLAAAEEHLLAALSIAERGQGDLAPLVANLGIVARLRGDLERSEMYNRRALELYRAADNSREVASKLINLGNVLADAGRFDEALAAHGEALAILQGRAPDREAQGQVHANRASLHRLRRDLDAMAADLAAARELLAFDLPRNPDHVLVTSLEAELARTRGDVAGAARFAELTLAACERIQPDTSLEAQAAAALAAIREEQGRLAEAEALFDRALRALERQQQRLGGGDRGLVAFRSKFAGIYRAYQDFLLRRGRRDAAFELYERSRAQALLALLRGRDLEFTERDLSPALARRRREFALAIDRAYLALARLPESDTVGRRTQRLALEELHAGREQLDREIHAASSRLAAVETPPALRLAEIRRALAPGTLLLAYSVGESTSTLFALPAGGEIAAHPLAAGAPRLADDIRRWRELTLDTALRRGELAALERRLGELLLGPVAAELATARRLLIVPDGPLHGLAFAALPDPGQPARRLVEALPVAHQVSASVHVHLAGRRARTLDRIAVFADPMTGEAAPARFRRELGRLPAARREAARVSEIFGERARVYLDAAATEAAARREIAALPLAHFATHAVIDEALPLDSALLLASAPGEEGLLQAWEIAEQLELESDLVVLSGCETARGGERSGEGVLGLVRALQVAGARSVVASLWRVDDESAAELMARFYARLNEGLPRDEALRQAQLELLRGPVRGERDGRPVELRFSAPRHWAPFVLIGPAD
jgi:CHAT domain-containing protein